MRRRGVGTQVVHSQARRPQEPSSRYDDLEAAGQGPTTRVVRNERVPAAADVAAALGIPQGTAVTLLERLHSTHGQPVAYLCNCLPPALPDLPTARPEGTGLYRLLRAAGVTLHSARQTIGARSATAGEAVLLTERAGAALLTMRRTAYDDTGRAVEYGTHVYRASRCALDLRPPVRP